MEKNINSNRAQGQGSGTEEDQRMAGQNSSNVTFGPATGSPLDGKPNMNIESSGRGKSQRKKSALCAKVQAYQLEAALILTGPFFFLLLFILMAG